MPCVYRYTDKADNIIKYVGIVWSDRRSLEQRIKEHSKEEKFQGHNWEIEYIDCEGRSRTDTEYLEAHYISLYQTYKYLNSGKSNWGVSQIISDNENEWKQYEYKEQVKVGNIRRSNISHMPKHSFHTLTFNIRSLVDKYYATVFSVSDEGSEKIVCVGEAMVAKYSLDSTDTFTVLMTVGYGMMDFPSIDLNDGDNVIIRGNGREDIRTMVRHITHFDGKCHSILFESYTNSQIFYN